MSKMPTYTPPPTAKPYTLSIPDDQLTKCRELLSLSPLGPKTYENTQSSRNLGITYSWLSTAKDYWLNSYSWRAQEAHINSFSNYTMVIESVPVHFIGLFSQKEDAIPVIFMHGWPGSFIEFLPMLELVREKWKPEEMPFHCVVASLPGYTLSSQLPVDKDWTMGDSARVLDQLMRELGFPKYIAQGGDVGSFIAQIMAVNYEGCVAMHLNTIPIRSELKGSDAAEVEKFNAIRNKWIQSGHAYAQEHATRPSTIGHVVSASPLAMLAWLGEKMVEWADEPPSLDDILTNVSLYWFTQGFPASIHQYRELFPARKPLPYVSKPTGYSHFPADMFPATKETIKEHVNLVHFKRHESGGHFSALEKPGEFLEDVTEFVGQVWKDGGAKL